MGDIERRPDGELERPRGPSGLTLVVYGLAVVGAFAVVRFVLGTLLNLIGLAVVVGVVVLVVLGVRGFLKGPPDGE